MQATCNVEVSADRLSKRRETDITKWNVISHFPRMNLVWSHLSGIIYFPRIPPETDKYCDIDHVFDPAKRKSFREERSALQLRPEELSLTFDVFAKPNHQGHIVGPGTYRLEIVIAADNARPRHQQIEITVQGRWDEDQARMLRDRVNMRVLPNYRNEIDRRAAEGLPF